MNKITSLAAAIILLTGSACQQVLPIRQTSPVDSGTTAAPILQAAMLYKDDFSDPGSGWTVAGSQVGSAGYADGVYRILVENPNSDLWATAGLVLSDVRLEVDALRAGGERNNRFGILCRVNGPGDFYVFLISSDGYYGIGKRSGGQYSLLGSQALLPSEKIPQGSAYLRIRADCVGDQLALYVNGEKISAVQDSEFSSGDVGLTAGAYQTAGTDIFFDNFAVYQP